MQRGFTFSLLVILLSTGGASGAEQVISVPGGIGNTFTLYPMRILQERVYSMRYQQVYAASAFAGVEPTNRFLTRLDLRVDEEAIYPISGTTTNLEIRLSTTSKSPDALSTAFAENNGSDEMLVYADTEPTYIRPNVDARLYIFILPKPFLYDAKKGNLLLDVRVETTGEPLWELNLALDAHDDPSDAVSRVYARSVSATEATDADTVGLNTIFHFNPVPSLQLRIETVLGANRPVVRWPAQPSVFVPQMSAVVGSQAYWQTITSSIGGSLAGPDRWIYLPVTPPGTSGFYRLIREGGEPAQAVAPANSAVHLPPPPSKQ